MGKTEIPKAVRLKALKTGMNAARILAKDHPQYGTVYELYFMSGTLPVPTGMPVVVSWKDGVCSRLSTEAAFELLAALGE